MFVAFNEFIMISFRLQKFHGGNSNDSNSFIPRDRRRHLDFCMVSDEEHQQGEYRWVFLQRSQSRRARHRGHNAHGKSLDGADCRAERACVCGRHGGYGVGDHRLFLDSDACLCLPAELSAARCLDDSGIPRAALRQSVSACHLVSDSDELCLYPPARHSLLRCARVQSAVQCERAARHLAV